MSLERKNIYLIDLPTFPKGQITLAFPVIASLLSHDYKVEYIDLNMDYFSIELINSQNTLFIGIKVSCQNLNHAIEITEKVKTKSAELKVIWGGELPNLLPEMALRYCDAIVSGSFETIANELISDCEKNTLKKQYTRTALEFEFARPDFSIIKQPERYSKIFGYPLETSKGCDRKCTFCMVHTMQPKTFQKTKLQLKEELKKLSGNFINVVDYNIGVSNEHLNNIIEAFTESNVLGWMAEMCIESLNDDELLSNLAKSKCKIIYCGLESVDEESLQSVNKSKTNNINNYKTIVRKAQKHGIQIAAGIIVGLPGSTQKNLQDTFSYFRELGLIYVKITFLTYNPGTKVNSSMKNKGEYITNDITKFDGNHFTFLPRSVDKGAIVASLQGSIMDFYSEQSIKERSQIALGNAPSSTYKWFEAVNHIYSESYFEWIKYNIFTDDSSFTNLLNSKYIKSEKILSTEIKWLNSLQNA